MQITKCDCCGAECEEGYYTNDRGDICFKCTDEISKVVDAEVKVIYDEARKDFGDATAHSVKLYNLIDHAFSCPEPDRRWGRGIMDLYREWKELTKAAPTQPTDSDGEGS